MSLTVAQRLDRLNVRLAELQFWRARETVPVADWSLDGAPLQVGAFWPDRDGTKRLAATAAVPAHWPLEEARLGLDVGGESLLSLTADGRTLRYGVDPYHQEFPLHGRQLGIETETVARLPFGEPVPEPRLERAELIWLDTGVDRLHTLLQLVAETVKQLLDHEVAPLLLDAAEDAQRSLDWPSATQDYIARFGDYTQHRSIWQLPELAQNPPGLNQAERASVAAAHEALVADLRALQQRFPPQGEIALTGHAHIDLAWLWPYAETRRKMRRTFHTALSLMEKSADFRFNQSTAHYYNQMAADDPALFAAIGERVKAGTWETVGGLWVEPDTNMPTGESLARQVLYGQRYFEKTFGTRHTVCWLPDCFGFTGAMPQILQQGGIDSFFTIKVNWSETNKIPADLFWWEGLDGSRVLAHTFNNPVGGYNGYLGPEAYLATWRNFRGKATHPATLLAVGYGDGGGGVTPAMVEREAQLRDFPVLPKARWCHVRDFYAAAHERASTEVMPVWQGEIYLELHRATLTTQSGVKKKHRQAERSLITAETLAGLAYLIGAAKPESLEPLWRVVLKNEFHDILPGSSIREVYEDAERELGEVIATGGKTQDEALGRIVAQLPKGDVGKALVVVNPTLSPRPLRLGLADGTTLAGEAAVPPLGIAVLDRAVAPRAGLTAGARHLENEFLRAEIGADGSVTSLVHKPSGREALAGRGNQLWAYPVDKPRNWDAWDVEEDYAARGDELTEVESIEPVENGPHRAAIRIVKRYRHSTITQTYALTANSRRLDIETELDWHDRRIFLRALTPVDVRASEATFECAYGVVRRPTHTNTSWEQAKFEVPGHRFADLSEPGFGLALLNNAKYGHSARGHMLGLSLVRSPVYPDLLADEGKQNFTYALMPHAGSWDEGGVLAEAEDLNQPLLVAEASGLAAGITAPLSVAGIPAALSALKPAEDGNGLVLRVYEPAGRRGDFAVTAPRGWAVGETVDILEEPRERGPGAALRPFEIMSRRISRG
jgi:alpha-mannosidase